MWQQLELASKLESDLRYTVDWGRKSLVDFNAGKTFQMLGLTFSSKLDWDSHIISLAKTAFKKILAFICSMRFLSPEIALYLYKSNIRSCMDYCCRVWARVPSCYLELSDKLQNLIKRTASPSIAASLEPLAHCRNVASLSDFYRNYFGRCSSELDQLVPLPYS